jgi:malonate decarboxylase gamma subunit
MGAIADIWQGDLAACLIDALAQDSKDDNRRRLGAERQGRTLAEKVAERVRRGAR